jgi:hypothetical protein
MEKDLYQLVYDLASRIALENHNFRCHEIIRLLKIKLREAGYVIKVKDGIAVYDIATLEGEFLSRISGKKTGFHHPKGNRKSFSVHSWGEYKDKSGRKIISDWQDVLRLSPNITLTMSLIVGEEKNLTHVYRPCGLSLGKWLLILCPFRPFRLFFIKLRCQRTK